MPRPEFSHEEIALLVQLRQQRGIPYLYELAYLVPSGLLVGFGFLRGEPAAFAAAFSVIATFTVWQMRAQSRSLETLRRILQKYETAADATADARQSGG